MTLSHFLCRLKQGTSDLHEIIPISYNMQQEPHAIYNYIHDIVQEI